MQAPSLPRARVYSLLEGNYSAECRIVVECIAKPLNSAPSRIIDSYLILPLIVQSLPTWDNFPTTTTTNCLCDKCWQVGDEWVMSGHNLKKNKIWNQKQFQVFLMASNMHLHFITHSSLFMLIDIICILQQHIYYLILGKAHVPLLIPARRLLVPIIPKVYTIHLELLQ